MKRRASRVNSAFSQVETRLGQSASQIAAGMEAAGQSTAGLMQAVGKADAAAARVGDRRADPSGRLGRPMGRLPRLKSKI